MAYQDFGSYFNLVVSIIVFSIGCFGLLRFFSIKKPAIFEENPFLVDCLWFAVGNWFCFVLIWLFICFGNKGVTTATRITADLGSILGIGFSLAFLWGSGYVRVRLIGSLLLVVLPFVACEIGVGLHIHNAGITNPDSLNRLIAPSQVLAIVQDGFLAVAFLFRYGRAAVLMVLSCIYYAALQHPAYTSVFISPTDSGTILVLLAIGKIFMGSVFYAMFFQPAEHYDPINIPVFHMTNSRKIVKRTAGYTSGIILVCCIMGLFIPSPFAADIKKALWGLAGVALGTAITDILVKLAVELLRKMPSEPEKSPKPVREEETLAEAHKDKS